MNDKNLSNYVYANCVGYALEQCYSSSIEILGPINSDEEHFSMLKALLSEYEQACEIVDDEDLLQWGLKESFKDMIRNATCIDDIYKK